MADVAEHRRQMDAHDLHRALDNFISDNQRNNAVEYRWLAQQVMPLKQIAYHLYANGVKSFGETYAKDLAELRLAEIENERSKIASADAKLEEEAKLLKRRTAA